jgi:hypothetical protein
MELRQDRTLGPKSSLQDLGMVLALSDATQPDPPADRRSDGGSGDVWRMGISNFSEMADLIGFYAWRVNWETFEFWSRREFWSAGFAFSPLL